uniref:DUF4283 domain-containing protein n=1 Tax=Lactuca sativa TaxID=4236 RepID=A0A9R1V1F1_LACSA|nr:hypothetical protein LSAT_V11C700342380 [Lactuca sativa]
MSPKGTRIIIGWDPDEVVVMPLDANSQVMHCQVLFIKENKRLFCSFVYGCNYYIDRRKLWDSLEKHYYLVAGHPWLIVGDFNVTRELVDSMADNSKITRGEDSMFGKFGSMFGKNSEPPDLDNKVYEDEEDADVGAKRRGRRAVHKEISPYSGNKPLQLKEKMESKANRIQEEKKYLNSKSPIERSKVVLRAGVHDVIKSGYGKENIDLEFIKSELNAFEKAIADEKKLESQNKIKTIGTSKLRNEMVEEKGFVMLPVTSDMLEGFISSKDNIGANRSSSQSPVDESISSRGFNSSKEMATGSSSSTPGSVIETKNNKGILGKSPLSQAAPVNSGSPLISDANPIAPISCPTNYNDEDMKDLMNECENLEDDDGNNVKTEQGANFLKMDFSKPVISPAAKMVSDFNKNSYARMVEATNTVSAGPSPGREGPWPRAAISNGASIFHRV